MSFDQPGSIPNETDCPVGLEVLALLLRSDDATKAEMIRAIPGPRRARLAFFCYNRVHLRSLAFTIAGLCDLAELRLFAGAKGDLLYTQATEQGFFEDGDNRSRRKGVTLARTANG